MGKVKREVDGNICRKISPHLAIRHSNVPSPGTLEVRWMEGGLAAEIGNLIATTGGHAIIHLLHEKLATRGSD